jgi:DNA replication and repair protein RecF
VLIKRLEITGVRNIERALLPALGSINILYGDNGSGKTSILEAIHLLSSARSFRSHKLKPLINLAAQSCVAFAEIDIPGIGFQPVGVERFKSPSTPGLIRVGGQAVKSAAVLAENLPLQVISSDTFKLLEGSPSIRRQFLDWGVFHVEHRFHPVWKSNQRCLKQRNTLLRHGRIDDQQLAVWTEEFIALSEQLDAFRQQYFDALIPVFEHTLARLIDLEGLHLSYHRGWDRERSLVDVMSSNEQREKEQGYTLSGPHRADLRIRYQSCDAADILSRGQQKLVVCALRVSQGYLLSKKSARSCVYLIDDLPSELDKHHRTALCSLLEELGCQVFVSCVDPADLSDCWSPQAKLTMFHVEHGNVVEKELTNKE